MKKAYKLLRVNGRRITGKNRFNYGRSKRYKKHIISQKYGFEPKLKIIFLVILAILLIGIMQAEKSFEIIKEDCPVVDKADYDPCELNVVDCPSEIKEEFEAKITAYNTVPNQTDNSPCIAAFGDNVCGKKNVVACPIRYNRGTKVRIGGEIFECLDRMNEKYWHENRFDICMDKDIDGAVSFGVKTLKVQILN